MIIFNLTFLISNLKLSKLQIVNKNLIKCTIIRFTKDNLIKLINFVITNPK